MDRKKLIGICLCQSLVLGAFLCVGMGMDMRETSVGTAKDHSCCETIPTDSSDPCGTPSCCIFVPGIAGSSIAAPKPVVVASLSQTGIQNPSLTDVSRLPSVHSPPETKGKRSPVASRAPPTL